MDKVYSPQTIPDQPFPISIPANEMQPQTVGGGMPASGFIATPSTIQTQPLPLQQNADNVISPRLDTKTKQILANFSFAPSGALKIGGLNPGVSGEIDIDSEGIVAKDRNGDTEFALNAEDGSAVFAGELASGTILSGAITVGDTIIDKEGIAFKVGQLFSNTPRTTTNTSYTSVPGSGFTIHVDSGEPVLVFISVFAYIQNHDPNYQQNGYYTSVNLKDITNNFFVMDDISSPGVPATYISGATETTRTNSMPGSESVLVLVDPGTHNYELQFEANGGGTAEIDSFNIQIIILGPQHP